MLQFHIVNFCYLSATQRSKYFWYIKDYTGEFSRGLDWSLDMMFHEEIKDEQGWLKTSRANKSIRKILFQFS